MQKYMLYKLLLNYYTFFFSRVIFLQNFRMDKLFFNFFMDNLTRFYLIYNEINGLIHIDITKF